MNYFSFRLIPIAVLALTTLLLSACGTVGEETPTVTTAFAVNLTDAQEFDSAVIDIRVDGSDVSHERYSPLDLNDARQLQFDVNAPEGAPVRVVCMVYLDGNAIAITRSAFNSGATPNIPSLQFLAGVEVTSPISMGSNNDATLSVTVAFRSGFTYTLGVDSVLWDTDGDGDWDISDSWPGFTYTTVAHFAEITSDTLRAAFGMRYVDGTITRHEILILAPSEGSSFVDPRDGTTYPVVVIGEQTWLGKNLSYLPSGTPEDGISCYGDSLENCELYGALYDASMAAEVCPSGWHLPSEAEVNALFETIGGFTAANKLLSTNSEVNPNATNSTGFSLLLGGMGIMGTYSGGGLAAFLWGSDVDSEGLNFYWTPYSTSYMSPLAQLSVRCLQD